MAPSLVCGYRIPHLGGETIGSVQVTQAPQGNLLITDTSTGVVYLFDGVEVRPFFTIGEDVG